MAQITLKGNPIHTNGELPSVNTQAPNVNLTKTDLSDISLDSYKGQNVVLNIFPSLDAPTCALTVRKFNQEAAQLPNTVVLCISADLPFAQARFCAAEGLKNVVPASVFRHPGFAELYGVRITDGPIAGLLSRAIVVLDKNQRIVHTEQVTEIANEPNYAAVINAIQHQQQ